MFLETLDFQRDVVLQQFRNARHSTDCTESEDARLVGLRSKTSLAPIGGCCMRCLKFATTILLRPLQPGDQRRLRLTTSVGLRPSGSWAGRRQVDGIRPLL